MFQGLKVLELASVLAGPSVGQFFAELGAEVIKVENTKTSGDVTRCWKSHGEDTDDRSAYFCAVNWGKKSVALDLSSDSGRATVHRLAKRSDVVIASYKPGDAEKLGVDYTTLAQIRPDLIYGQVTGYGSHNERVGYDAVLQAEAGFMYMNGEKGGNSLKIPVAVVDVLAAHHLKEGLLLALLSHARTGKGAFVEVSLLQAAISSLVNQATNWLIAKKLPQKQGSDHPNIAPYGDTFRTSDGEEILLAVGNDKQFAELCGVLNVSSIASDTRFRTNPARVQHRNELKAILESEISNRMSGELMELLHEKKIPAGLIQNLRQVFEMPEAQELLLQVGPLIGVRTYAGSQNFAARTDLLLPPHFGEHNAEIIALL
jgi:crotonobetainyl-CoA:carnitine CoA-transferase CaiB-like acyl-CoA transferase